MIDPVFYLKGFEIWDFLFIGDTLQLWATGIIEDYLIKNKKIGRDLKNSR